MQKRLFHLTPAENAEVILRDGLNSDPDGFIFAFTDPSVANTVARDQVFCRTYVVFEIDRGKIGGDIGPDNVGEWSHVHHAIIHQKHIAPDALRMVGKYRVVGYDLWDAFKNMRLGVPKDICEQMVASAREREARDPHPEPSLPTGADLCDDLGRWDDWDEIYTDDVFTAPPVLAQWGHDHKHRPG